MIKNCPMRHENGNCIPAGGFCTANKNICEALHNAYRMGKAQLSSEDTTSDMISRQAALEKVRTMQTYKLFMGDDMILIDKAEVQTELMMLPSVQPVATDTNVGNNSEIPNSSDAVSRQAAIDALDVLCQEHRYRIPGKRETYSEYNEAWQDALDRAEGLIFNLPPAQPEPQEGYWIRTDCGLDVECKCSKCGYRDFVEPRDWYWFKRNYCPNCGAKMKGAKHESN